MASKHIFPSRKPCTAKETQNALRELGFTDHLRNGRNSAKDAIEVIPSNVPTDVNIGQSYTIKDTITAALTSIPQPAAIRNYEARGGIKRSPSSELLKIDGLNSYMNACAEYNQGLREGWGKERLLQRIEEWQELDRKRLTKQD
ncbi:Nn.00g077430.m01.CDS01 [Neocucurbitaria sp. VM-36]